MSDLDRRDFLKVMGTGAAGAVATTGCYRYSDLPSQLIPYVVQPEEITPGVAVTYASTCQECPVGCGLHVRTREGRPVKLEGNPDHPINRGKLCARGQAGIVRTYHPDRFRGAMARGNDGHLAPIGWQEADAKLVDALRGAGGKVAVLSGHTGPTLSSLIDRWLESVGGGTRVTYEPFANESLRGAANAVFGIDSSPIFDLSDSDYVIDFGADVVGTGPSPVEHARQIMAARDASTESGRAARLVYVGPRLDETASVSDEWLPAKPGTEGLLAMAIARVALDEAQKRGATPVDDPAILSGLLAEFGADVVAPRCGVSADVIRRIGREIGQAKRPVALPPGVALTSRRATAANAAVLVLDAVVGAIGRGVTLPVSSGPKPSFREVVKLIDAMKAGDVAVLVIHGSNPLYSLPPDSGFAEALERVGLVVSTASMPDETALKAHLVMPDLTPLESWGDAAPRPGVRSLVQPTLRPLFDTRAFGDTLLVSGRALGDARAALPAGADFHAVLQAAWGDTDWRQALMRGGSFQTVSAGAVPVVAGVSRLEVKEPQLEGDGSFVLLPVPSPLLGDGRGANIPQLQETPDPITKITWQSWAEISKKTAESLELSAGDVMAIETTFGRLEVPVWPRGGLRDDVVALAVGQGHTVGRYASLGKDGAAGAARGVNVVSLLPALTDESGARAWLSARAKLSNTGRHERLPYTQGTDNKRGRFLGNSISLVALAKGENPWAPNQEEANHPLTLSGGVVPHPQTPHAEPQFEEHGGGHHEGPHEVLRAYDPRDDATTENPFRWGMTIDVDRCTGCSACVMACSIENNIVVVGEEGVRRHRQMSWLRIERYVGEGEQTLQAGRPGPQNGESLGNVDVRNSPMLCQQCGAAPCEPVCPVIATYHTPSGLNGMIYNRCIGTRYCSNNCPYKVRRFNWFDYQIETWPQPMELMLNPDVTVRGQGVMEKCTFCIQRIQSARNEAKSTGDGLPADGSIRTACQQTCPTDAIVFGNLKDDGSQVNAVAARNEGRVYRALHVLNTRPAISYLAKVQRVPAESGSGEHHAAAPSRRPENA